MTGDTSERGSDRYPTPLSRAEDRARELVDAGMTIIAATNRATQEHRLKPRKASILQKRLLKSMDSHDVSSGGDR